MAELYYGGRIITMQSPDDAPEAVLVDNGRIVATGKMDALRSIRPDARPTDLRGRCLMPAFIDAHSHFSSVAASTMEADLSRAASGADIEAALRDFIKDNSIAPGQWVQGGGYDHNDLPHARHPERALLDRAAPDNPVLINHASGHMGVANSMALRRLGLDENSPVPDGGAMGMSDGLLNGYLEESAYFAAKQRLPQADMGAMLAAYEKAQTIYAAHGVTTVQEGMMVAQMTPLYKALLARGILKIDLVGYPGADCADELYGEFSAYAHGYRGRFRLGGMKIFLDGSPQGRTAYLRAPYEGEDRYRGYPTMEKAAVYDAVAQAARKGRQILAHCNGDAACALYIDALLNTPAIAALRPVIIHAQCLGTDQLYDVKRAGAIPSFFIAHVYRWGDAHIKNLGLKRASAISPAASALDMGIKFTFHQDSPVLAPDMLQTVWCAAQRRTRDGVSFGVDERISVYEALRAVTINAAYQYFEEGSKGSLTPGKLADMAVLSHDPLSTPVEELPTIRVIETIKEGKRVFCAD